ncbi:MAG: glycosyltransferase, partial [Lachnospiraceae bacterium]|nr:glycosyltransferase [Lachnospiraceae bacterium]
DNTPDAIKKVMEENPNVRMEHRETEKGLATAVLEGFKLAKGDYIAVMDADLQHPPAILRSMYAVMETGVDFCVPSRFIPGGSDGGLGPYRKLVSGVARYIGKIMLPSLRKITDPTSGLFMFRRSVIEGADLRPIGWKIMVEVLAMGSYRTVVEIPYKFQARPAGESKLSSKVTVEYLKQVAELTRRGKKQSDVTVTRWSASKLKSELEKIG